MIYVCILEGTLIGAALFVILMVTKSAADERRELEDRLMAVFTPMALTHVDAVRAVEPEGSIRYVDEESYTARGANNADATP